jgi:predicted nucleotidyltransferase
LESEAKELYKKEEPKIVDIILFGSTLKGKEKPDDVDILALFKSKIDYELVQRFRRALEKKLKMEVEITAKTYPQMFSAEFLAREGLLESGYSLINKVSLAEGFGYRSLHLFTYRLGDKSKSERMRFYYALYGRNGVGILQKLKAEKYTDTMVACPTESCEEMKQFFGYWKVEYKDVPVLMVRRGISQR